MSKARRNKGVTLIELLIVVLILAALSAIAIPRISQSAENAKVRADETNLSLLNSAVEQYYVENGEYPSGITDNDLGDYFPEGVPTAQQSGYSFTYNSTTHRVEYSGD